MTEAEIELFRSVAERDPPRKRVRELWVVAGRRAGKDSVASLLAGWFAAFQNYDDVLRPGEVATIMCLACDRSQAKIVENYTRGYFTEVEMLRPLVTRETADGFVLSTGAEISVMTNSYRSVRGRSIALAILDECAFWRDETSATPDTDTYGAIVRGQATIPGSMLIGISSPHRRSGLLYDKFKAAYGKDDADVLVVKGPSRTFNPTIDPAIIDADMARDPARARADWLAEWRDDIAAYLPRELIEDAVDDGVLVRPPVAGVKYFAFADPSGGVSDSFCVAVAHRETDEKVVLDCLREIKAPFNPTSATAEISSVLKSYNNLREVVGDRYSAGFVVDAFGRFGIKYVHSERDRSAILRGCVAFVHGRPGSDSGQQAARQPVRPA
jgi:hypothetical protein